MLTNQTHPFKVAIAGTAQDATLVDPNGITILEACRAAVAVDVLTTMGGTLVIKWRPKGSGNWLSVADVGSITTGGYKKTWDHMRGELQASYSGGGAGDSLTIYVGQAEAP